MEVAGWTRLVLGNMWRPFRGKAATTVLKRTIYEHPVNYNNTFPSDRSFGRWVIRKQIHLYLPRPGDFLHRGLQKTKLHAEDPRPYRSTSSYPRPGRKSEREKVPTTS
jgi:hypothetical protein